jgi:hypothetical protein
VRGNCSARLLSIESPIAEKYRIGGIAEIEDEDVVPSPPSVRGVISAPSDDVGDPRIAFLPAFVRPARAPAAPVCAPRTGFASGDGAHAHGIARRPEGSTVDEVVNATGWQRHTVRGVLSGTLKKKLGFTIASTKEERGRVYRIAEPASI